MVFAGPAGIGKSRLAAELADRAAGSGHEVRRVTATPATQAVPLGVLGQAFGEAEVAAIVAEAEAVGRDGRELVLVVDDAHLLDGLSAAALHRLAAGGAASLLLTVRSGELVPPSIVALWTEDHAARVEVGPLSRLEADDLVEAVLGGPVAAATRDELWRLSLGNVLFLHELVSGAQAAGTLAVVSGVWSHIGPLGGTARLDDTVGARLDTFGPDAAGVLELLAVAGRLGLRIVEKLVDPSVVARLEEAGLLRVVEDGRRLHVEAGHPLYAEVVGHRMSRSRRRAVAAALVAALEATGGRRSDDTLAMGCWLLEAGGGGDASTFARAAAEADRRGDPRLAERLARAALGAGDTGEAMLVLGESLRGQGRNAEAEPILAELASGAADPGMRARAARWLAKLRFFDPDRCDQGMTTLADARAAAPAPWDRLLAAEHAMMLFYRGRFAEAAALADPIAGGPGDDPDDTAAVLALSVLAGTRAWLGTPVTALNDARRGIALAQRVAPEFSVSILASSLFANLMAGRHPATIALPHDPDPTTAATVAALGVGTLMFEGRAAEAIPLLDGILDVLRAVNPEGALAVFLALRAEAAALTGDAASAMAVAAEARDALGPYACYEYVVDRAEVWATVAQGRIAEATDLTLAAAGRHRDHPGHAALALHDAARLGAATEAAAPLAEITAAVPEPGLVATLARQAAAVVAADGEALAAVARTYAGAGTRLWAAEAAAQGAQAHDRTGDALAAARLRRFSDEHAAACGRPAVPALASAPPGLTPREEEIARLAAQGLTNAAIGARLYLSVRTVENHLAHVYDKLGVRGRRALADLMSGRPDPQ